MWDVTTACWGVSGSLACCVRLYICGCVCICVWVVLGGGGVVSKQAKESQISVTLGKSGCLVCVCVWMAELLNRRTTKQERQVGLDVDGLNKGCRFQPNPWHTVCLSVYLFVCLFVVVGGFFGGGDLFFSKINHCDHNYQSQETKWSDVMWNSNHQKLERFLYNVCSFIFSGAEPWRTAWIDNS